MSPREKYQLELAKPGVVADPVQASAIDKLEVIYQQVLARATRAPARLGWWSWSRGDADKSIGGLYLCGGVGRGKTLVVDLFHQSFPPALARRVHFHTFMRGVHAELKARRGIQNPLQEIAAAWAQEFKVLCLDEFHVVDITDAMLLAQLLTALFAERVTLIATSNELPDALYAGGLQRERFLPAIALMKAHLEVYEFHSRVDYRLRKLTEAATYYLTSDATANHQLQERFSALTQTALIESTSVLIEGRSIEARAIADGIAWFDFDTLCRSARSSGDYIELACCFHTVLVSDVPRLDDDQADAVRRFIHLVDEFYDRGVNVLVSAAARPPELYVGRRLTNAFQRTVSRLIEMQSEEYLAKPHQSG